MSRPNLKPVKAGLEIMTKSECWILSTQSMYIPLPNTQIIYYISSYMFCILVQQNKKLPSQVDGRRG